MRIILIVVAAAGLVLTLLPSLLLFAGLVDWSTNVCLMFVGMICWFVAAPFLMKVRQDAEE